MSRGMTWIAVLLLAGCGQEAPEQSAPVSLPPMVHLAAMSDDGLAVAADVDELLVNDGGRTFTVQLSDLAEVMVPGESGVWVGVEGAAYFIHRGGHVRFATSGTPSAIFPTAGATAYVIDANGLVFIGKGLPGQARRRSWSIEDRDMDTDIAARDQDYGIHFYDR